MSEDKETTTEDVFQGYTSPNYTQVPDELFDRQLPGLSGAELKALLYVMRRTFGFKKNADNISLNQICRGITTRDGRVLDRGTGLSKSTAQLAIKGLLEKNIILTTKRFSRERGNEATTYALNVPSRRPYTENRHRGAMPEIGTALYRKSTPQETVQQQTDFDHSKFETSHDQANQEDRSDEARAKHHPETTAGRLMPLGEVLHLRAVTATGLGDAADQLIAEPQAKPRPARQGSEVGTSEERERLRPFLEKFAQEFGDEAPLSSTLTRVLNIFRETGVPPERWGDLVFQARGLTKERGPQIRKPMPYFLSTLEQLVGLRLGPKRSSLPSNHR